MNPHRSGKMTRLPDRTEVDGGWFVDRDPAILTNRAQSSLFVLNRAKPIDQSWDARAEHCSALHANYAQPSAFPVCALRLSKKLVSIRAIRVKAFFPTPKMHRPQSRLIVPIPVTRHATCGPGNGAPSPPVRRTPRFHSRSVVNSRFAKIR